jgi:hypothetical protein
MSDLFVSWSGTHALRVGELIRDLFAPFSKQYRVFLSSRDLPIGEIWRTNLLEKLHSADHGVIIFSQDGIKSDWQLHESAVLSALSNPLDIFLFEAPRTMLPLPLRDFQTMNLNYQTMEVWINKIIKDKKLDLEGRRKQNFLSDIDSLVNDYQMTHVIGADSRWREGVLD